MIYLLKKVVRIVTFSDSSAHSVPLFNLLNVLTIQDIFKIEILKFVHDCLNKNNPPQFHNYFTYSLSNLNTANLRDLKLHTPQIRTSTYGLKSLLYNGVIVWNNVPLTLRSITSRKLFAAKLKKLFISLYSSDN